MRSPKTPSTSDVALELIVAFGIQLGLSRLLAKASALAEEHEFEPAVSVSRQMRPRPRPVASTLA